MAEDRHRPSSERDLGVGRMRDGVYLSSILSFRVSRGRGGEEERARERVRKSVERHDQVMYGQ